MKPDEYFDDIAGEIRNPEARARFLEDLREHWEDAKGQADADPSSVLGDAALLTHQVNAVASRRSIGWSIVLVLFSCFVTLVLGSTLSAYIPKWSANMTSLFQGLTFALWLIAAFALYVAVHHRMAMYPRIMKLRIMPFIAAFYGPLAFAMYEHVPPLLSDAAGYSVWYSIRGFMSGVALTLVFILAGLVVSRYLRMVDRAIGSAKRWLPWALAVYVTVGCAMLIWSNPFSDGPGAILAAPFIVPLMVAYLLWALASLSPVAFLPAMSGFWLTTAAFLSVGVILPVLLWMKNKQLAFAFRLAAGFIVPIFLIIPFVPQDVPQNMWNVPVVWTWDELERKQLNVVYPWAASLMRRNDGTNVSYGARIENGVLEVIQAGGVVVEFADATPVVRHEKMKIDDAIYADFPATGFACNGTPIADIWDTHSDTTSPMGMFGGGCGELTYNGRLIGTLDRALIDLDLAPNGLLAVGINMGSYDPTYVYVVDISGFIKE